MASQSHLENPTAAALQAKFLQGMTFHQQKKLADAEFIYMEVLQQQPFHFGALHMLGVIALQTEQAERGVELIRKAIARNAKVADAHCNLGNGLRGLNRLEEALTSYNTAIALNPDYASAWLGRASIFVDLKRYDDAFSAYDKALALNSDLAEAWLGRGYVFNELKRYDEAFSAYDRAVALIPNFAEAWLCRGNTSSELKRYDEAIVAYDKALALKPNLAGAWLGRGNAFAALKRYDEAFAAYDKALTPTPDLAEAWLGRGNILRDLKRYDEAFAAYDKVLALKPDLVGAWLGRGNIFVELKRCDEAFAAYDKALALKPDFAAAWFGRGNVFSELKQHELAVSAYAKVLEIDRQHPFTKGLILHQRMMACDWDMIGELIAEIDSDVTAGNRSAEPFGYQATAHSAWNYKRCAEIYVADRFPRSNSPLWRGERYNNSKIRVGYLSGEFRNHVVSRLMTGLFELHDKNCFEIFAFDNGWDDGSELRGRINKAFNAIIDISHLDDLQAARAVRQKQIDILVNLNGYHGEGRTRIFSYKPAPIQINYLGFTATMGADYIDYIIADEYVVPPASEKFYSENVVYLPGTYQVNDTKRPLADRTLTRAEVKLPDTAFVFCCFNNNFKITPEIFDVWMRILKKVTGSVLWLTENNSSVSRNLQVEAKYRNIAPERLVFAPKIEYSLYLSRYRVADLFLDTVPFNGGATASDALWAGLPVVTCSGQTFTSRMAGSLLNAIGLPELITTTLEAYERLAIDLATHPEKLAIINRKLAENRLTTPLFDTKLFTKHIEAAYGEMYERHQAGLTPDHIVISR